MNFLQRIIGRWWMIWATFLGVDASRLTPLPSPLINPRRSAADLIAEADAQGVADARAETLDNWSFGGPKEAPSDAHDPAYVRALRHQGEAAVAALRESHRLTDERVAPIRQMRDEQASRMNDARTRMSELAVRDRTLEALRLDDADSSTDTEPTPGPETPADEAPWEGESNPLGLPWRLLILAGLAAAELPVQLYIFERLFNAGDDGTFGRWMGVINSAVVVAAPFIAGLLIRNRQASTAERRILHAVLLLTVGWLSVVGLLGWVRGQALQADAAEQLHITPVTIIVMFVAMLLVIGSMAFMLGLARRHPFQEAYVRHRNRRSRFDMLLRSSAARINPAYAQADGTLQAPEESERAIREAYAAAEDAYFAGLIRTVGDPTFTEAVQQRRGLRSAL